MFELTLSSGALGFVAINNADSPWTASFTTSLPAGSYCDVISGKSSSGSCTGTEITISGGSFTATVSARSAVAIHTGARGTISGTVAVTFAETATTIFGENIFIAGSIFQLGDWDPASSLPLSSASYPVWALTVPLPASTVFEYKFIRKAADGAVTWESDPNRQATVAASGSQTLTSSWR
ncbi:hypothetical protein C0995_007733 [Termitomyces sp. Mi166|nr:hypothetical protein C0995_007733 [Termitomyces sp. Mi166\